MQPEFKPGLWGSGAHAVYHGPAASWGLSCLGHDQDLAGTRGAWGFKGASCFSLDTAAAGRGLMPSSPILMKNYVWHRVWLTGDSDQ